MRILHVIRSLDLRVGGPTQALILMALALSREGVEVDVAYTRTGVGADGGSLLACAEGVRLFGFANVGGGRWSFSRPLGCWLSSHVGTYDLVHVHGVWTFPPLMAARYARKMAVPLVLRPAGTLDIYPMSQKLWRKKIYYHWAVKNMLTQSAAIHATSSSEARQLGRLTSSHSIRVIPLAVNAMPTQSSGFIPDEPLRLLFLSRIHPKKGLPVLIQALARLHERGIAATLAVAGDGEADYLQFLHRHIAKLRLELWITFHGFLQGEEKNRLMAASHLFVLPSHQENFGLAVVEAMAAGLPVVVSDQVALAEDVELSGAGLVVPVDQPESLAGALGVLTDPARRRIMAQKGPLWVQEKFSMAAMGRSLSALYHELVQNKNAAKIMI
ncbi:MAG: hypothetical protein HW380_428 [Magnetococcales bacterium]|nr:hypothetical protein [Magnetococcales bacterium]HIJ83678.1 glycosyltransferase [Magnetococcales bacterium]